MNNSTKRNVIKLLYFMSRLTFLVIVVILTFTGLIRASEVKSQNLKEVNVLVHTKGANLKEILNDIEKKSGFSFVYSEDIGKISNINLPDKIASLYDVLKEIGRQKQLKFSQQSYMIAVTMQPSPPPSGVIEGIIYDAKTKETLIGAVIIVGSGSYTTDVNGHYKITLQPGVYDLEIRYVG